MKRYQIAFLIMGMSFFLLQQDIIAADYKINKSIFGYYLGESKASLLDRLKNSESNKRAYSIITESAFPYAGYRLLSPLNNSKIAKGIHITFLNDYVYIISVGFSDNSAEHFNALKLVLEESWGVKPISVNNIGIGAYAFECSFGRILLCMKKPFSFNIPPKKKNKLQELWDKMTKGSEQLNYSRSSLPYIRLTYKYTKLEAIITESKTKKLINEEL